MTDDTLFTCSDDIEQPKDSNRVIEYSKTEAELNALREVCATTVFDVKTPSGMKQATSLRAKVRTLRTGVEKLRKEAKAPVLALGKLIDSKAERITTEILALEKPIDEKIKAEELRKAEEKKIEVDRIAKVQEWFDNLNKAVIDCVGQPSTFIKDKIDEIAEHEVLTASMFKERGDEAINLKSSTLEKLNVMLHFAEQGEKDRAEIAEKTKRLEGVVDDFEVSPPVPDGYDSWLDYANNPKGDSKSSCELGLVPHEYEDIRTGETVVEYEPVSLTQEYNPYFDLFELMDSEYGVTLIDTELDGVARAAIPIIGIDNAIIPKSIYDNLVAQKTIPSSLPHNYVAVDRVEYEHLLWLTTLQPIETAPRDGKTNVLMNCGSKYDPKAEAWSECFFVRTKDQNGGYWDAVHGGEARPEYATHWLPLPNTPTMPTTAKPKLDDADDMLGR